MVSESFIYKLDGLTKLHAEATKAITLAEFYSDGKFYIALQNELKNALFHIMEMVKSKEENFKCDEEFQKAESHLNRAIGDAYELLCLTYYETTVNILRQYDTEDIIKIFPAYYSQIRPAMLRISEMAALKKNDNKNEEFLCFFRENVSILMEYYEQIHENIPLLAELKKQRKKNTQKKWFRSTAIAIIIAIAFFVLGLYIS